jgi:hypothetical protein
VTLEDIEAIDREYLTAQEVASALNCNPHSIRVQARRQPKRLGFAVCVIGQRVKIPKQAFLHFMASRGTA